MDNHKKELISQFKQRLLEGGVCITRNLENGRYYLEAVTNPKGSKSRFDFAQMTDSCISPMFAADWKQYGGKAFVFEILETIEQKETQTPEEFKADLQILGELWAEKFDPALAYSRKSQK